jgi:UDP-N-acetylglucosamine--N-acetylmuramyl-(pentapeptide) pyrophosphoryl-undecaprenol N-acetylglucosamine transferase
MCKKIVLVGGGTGGHAFPLVNLYKYISKDFPSWGDCGMEKNEPVFHWIGEKNSIESKLAADNEIPFSPIVCGKLRRYFSIKTLLLPFQVIVGILQSLWILNNNSPKSVFSKGWYVSIPVAITAWILHIPVYMHESDSVAWLANRVVAYFAKWIFCSFIEVQNLPKQKILGYGTLLSEEIIALANETVKPNPRTQILVSCGSQGSASIFDAVLELLPSFTDVDFHVILWVKNLDYRAKFEKFPNVHIFDFFYNQTEYLKVVQQCDLVIARSGSSIFEFEALRLHMILIPHPFTWNNHQYWNAKAFEKKGHELLEQKNISDLTNIVEKYRSYKKSSEKMVVNMSIFDTITQILLK